MMLLPKLQCPKTQFKGFRQITSLLRHDAHESECTDLPWYIFDCLCSFEGPLTIHKRGICISQTIQKAKGYLSVDPACVIFRVSELTLQPIHSLLCLCKPKAAYNRQQKSKDEFL